MPQQQRELNGLRQRCLPWDPAKVLPHNLTATAPVNAGGTALDQRSSALNRSQGNSGALPRPPAARRRARLLQQVCESTSSPAALKQREEKMKPSLRTRSDKGILALCLRREMYR